jgi:hypothetical protein
MPNPCVHVVAGAFQLLQMQNLNILYQCSDLLSTTEILYISSITWTFDVTLQINREDQTNEQPDILRLIQLVSLQRIQNITQSLRCNTGDDKQARSGSVTTSSEHSLPPSVHMW